MAVEITMRLSYIRNACWKKCFFQGSNESLQSDPGEEHYSSVPVTGELFVSLRYEMPSKKFEVHVHSANNLACADAKKSSSDP